MPVESENDRRTFVSADDFGVEVTIGASTFDAIFDHEFVESSGFSAEKPVIHCLESDLDGVAIDATAVVDGGNYIIREIQPDGTGMAMAILEAA
jgi:hypothetical protein